MYDNNVVFYVNMDNVSIDIITFADFVILIILCYRYLNPGRNSIIL